MSTTQPIRNHKSLQSFKNYYLQHPINYRNYVLIITGLNTALRISDILQLTWEMVYDSNKGEIRTHIMVVEKKTMKTNRIFLNKEIRKVLERYHRMRNVPGIEKNIYLFYSPRDSSRPLSRYQAYRIIRQAAERVGLSDNISCHSLRKTFGYHAWKQGAPPALLMSVYNHSSYEITKKYLCIDQDDKDELFSNIRL